MLVVSAHQNPTLITNKYYWGRFHPFVLHTSFDTCTSKLHIQYTLLLSSTADIFCGPAAFYVTSCSVLRSMAPSRGPNALARTLHTTLANHKGPVHVARYAKGTSKYVLTGGQDRTVRLWNPSSGAEIKVYAAHGYEVLSISVCVS